MTSHPPKTPGETTTVGKEEFFPTTLTDLQKRTQPRPPFLLALSRSLVGDVSLRDFLWGLVLIAAIVLLMARTSLTRVPQFKVGDVATERVVTPDDLAVINEGLTKLESDRAMAQVPVVFDYDPGVLKTTLARLHQYFSNSREILAQPGPASVKSQRVAKGFENEFGQSPSSPLLQALQVDRLNEALERSFVDILEQTYKEGVLNNTEALEPTPHSTRIVLRNIDDNTESTLSTPPPNASLFRARERFREEVVRLNFLTKPLRAELGRAGQGLITVNGLYNQRETLERRRAATLGVHPVQVLIPARTVLLQPGQPVTPGSVEALEAMRVQEARLRRPQYFAGLYLAVFLLVFFIWRFLLQRPVNGFGASRQFLLIMTAFVSLLTLVKVMLFSFELLSENFALSPFNDPLSSKFAIPYAAAAMLITLLLDANVGMICAIVFSLFVGYMARTPLLAIYALVSSLAAIYAVRQYRDRGAVIKAGLIVGFSNFIIVAGLILLGERLVDWKTLLFDLGNTFTGGFFVAGCVSLLLPLFESAFDICTDIRLLELSNLNLPILRRLAAEAPGTYHHSILVGILAEAAAEAIGANRLLARVACLYHDVGKIVKSSYYIENSKEATERHEQLAPTMSSLVIIDHVKEGLALARQMKLPGRVVEIIPQHHGTSLVTYFYHKAIKDPDTDEVGITEEQFRYPGPRPRSKEAGLIMLADSIEAAARTVEHPNPRKFQNVVDRIVNRFMNDHQLDESQLTLNEILLAKQAFIRALAGIYHQRIPYPGYDFSQPVTAQPS